MVNYLELMMDYWEALHQKANTHGISNDQEERIGDLEERLRDAERAHEDARSMLAEVSEVNKELLNDLRQTEAEGDGEATRTMLAEVSEINKELLNDLKQTEAEGVEIIYSTSSASSSSLE